VRGAGTGASFLAEGDATTALERIDHKLRRLRGLEASYHRDIKRAEEDSRRETIDKEKAHRRLEKIRTKYSRKIERLMPKIRELTHRRAELKA